MKCVICKTQFNGEEELINHYVKHHNIPRSDKILTRYANLRYSPLDVRSTANNLKIQIQLLKILKRKARYYTIEREKILLKKPKIIKLFDIYLKKKNDDLERLANVTWFLKHYNVYINEVDEEYRNNNIHVFKEQASCFRIKVEQKKDVDIDFTSKNDISKSPFEMFMKLVKVLFLTSFEESVKADGCFVQILNEIVVEFIKNEEEEEKEEDGGIYEFENDNDILLVSEERSIKEYSTISSGLVICVKKVYVIASSQISQKVTNSYNVIGSNWSLRRVINFNISCVYNNVDSFSYFQRLVKGKSFAEETSIINNESFIQLFTIIYDELRTNKKNRNKIRKYKKATSTIKQKRCRGESDMVDLTKEDVEELPNIVNKYLKHFVSTETEVAATSSTSTTPTVSKLKQQHIQVEKSGDLTLITPTLLAPPPLPPKKNEFRKKKVRI